MSFISCSDAKGDESTVGTVVAVGSGAVVTVQAGAFVGCEQPAATLHTVQISAGRIRHGRIYLRFFIKGISVSLVSIILLYTILAGNTTR